MTRENVFLLAGLGSAALLAAAFGFQYIGGFLPCAMCLWQRWPHVAAIVLAALGMVVPHAWLAGLGALTVAGNAGLAFYHSGVERGWWPGPSTCSGGGGQSLGDMSGEALLDFTSGPTVVMCDEAALHILGLSMASWNAIACAWLTVLWLHAISRPRRGEIS